VHGVALADGGEEVGVEPSVELARDTEDAEGTGGTRSTGGDMDTGVGECVLGVHGDEWAGHHRPAAGMVTGLSSGEPGSGDASPARWETGAGDTGPANEEMGTGGSLPASEEAGAWDSLPASFSSDETLHKKAAAGSMVDAAAGSMVGAAARCMGR
jgi:hypothetical protein